MSDNLILLFVYGTLLRGERNHSRMGSSRFLGEVATSNGLELRDRGRFPGMVKASQGCVQGELYRVNGEVLADLDELEGHPDHFWRTTIKLADGREVQAYLLGDDHARGAAVIGSGDWLQR